MSSPVIDRPMEGGIQPPLPVLKFSRSDWLLKKIGRASARPGPRVADLVAAVTLLAWPALLVRVLLLATTTAAFRFTDIRGFLSDLGVATLLGALAFIPRARLRQVLLSLGFVVTALVSLANFEHVRANGSSFDLAAASLLFDRTFASGSVFGVRALTQSALVLVPPVLGVLIYERLKARWGRRVRSLEFGVVVVLYLCLEAVVPVPNDRVHWRQQHPLAENMSRIWRRSFAGDWRRGLATQGALPPVYKHLHEQDLTGKSAFVKPRSIKNVLLILVEGLSRGHIFNMTDARGGPGWLSNLAEFAQRHVDYTQYISLQRQTNRGEYTIMCGDLPNLISRDSEMDVYSATAPGERAECLPGFLQRHGMKTIYLQAAPITFMGKDEFMPNAGFSSVLDTKWFSKAYSTSGWGVDDRAFFEQAGDLVLQLEHGGKPWFLSLLTVGTHHPYLIPPEWRGRSRTGAFEDSLMYLDAVLKQFFGMLEREHVLDDTLVLVTGDESAGYMLENETAEMMSQHSVPLIAAYPGDRASRVDERFTHSDLALSIADALGMAESSRFHGRSAFRRYSEGRRLVFGNIYLSKVGAVGPRDELLLCERSLDACSGFHLGKDGPFLSALTPREVGSEEAAALKQVVLALDREVPATAAGRVTLLNGGEVRLRPKGDEQLVFYGKYHDTHRPTRASVHLALTVMGGSVLLHHDIASKAGEVLYEAPRLALVAGMSLVWDYDLDLRVPIQQLEFRMAGYNSASTDAVIEVSEATVEFVEQPASESRPTTVEPYELVPRRFNVALAAPTSLNLLEQRGLLGRESCVKDGASGALLLDGCPDGTPIFGPNLPLPGAVKAHSSFRVKVDHGSALSFVELTAGQGREVLARSAPVALGEGHTKDVTVDLDLTRPHADIETRLRLVNVSNLAASVTEARLDVSP
jgi:Sulfatase